MQSLSVYRQDKTTYMPVSEAQSKVLLQMNAGATQGVREDHVHHICEDFHVSLLVAVLFRP